jgi:hypothetical protein
MSSGTTINGPANSFYGSSGSNGVTGGIVKYVVGAVIGGIAALTIIASLI